MSTRTPSAAAGALRIAAVGDLQAAKDSPRRYRRSFGQAAENADILLLAGDLTASGTSQQAKLLAEDLHGLGIPVVAVLGDRDHHSSCAQEVASVLTEAGVVVLDGDTTVVTCRGAQVAVAGVTGFGGGFDPHMIPQAGEQQTRAFARHGQQEAAKLETALAHLDRQRVQVRLALTHYAPTAATLVGEDPRGHMLLGSEHLGRAIDTHRVDLAVHAHAARGRTHGLTRGGSPVVNVSYRLIGTGYRFFSLTPGAGGRPWPRQPGAA